jgi:hypothetical protein
MATLGHRRRRYWQPVIYSGGEGGGGAPAPAVVADASTADFTFPVAALVAGGMQTGDRIVAVWSVQRSTPVSVAVSGGAPVGPGFFIDNPIENYMGMIVATAVYDGATTPDVAVTGTITAQIGVAIALRGAGVPVVERTFAAARSSASAAWTRPLTVDGDTPDAPDGFTILDTGQVEEPPTVAANSVTLFTQFSWQDAETFTGGAWDRIVQARTAAGSDANVGVGVKAGAYTAPLGLGLPNHATQPTQGQLISVPGAG